MYSGICNKPPLFFIKLNIEINSFLSTFSFTIYNSSSSFLFIITCLKNIPKFFTNKLSLSFFCK